MPGIKKKEYTGKDIVRVLGVALCLFCFLVLLSPSSPLYGFSVAVFYLFGFTGFWILLPALFVLGISLFLLGGVPGGRSSKRFFLSFLLAYAGVAFIVGRYCLPYAPSLSGLSLFNGGDATLGMGYVLSGNQSDIATMPEFGGGILVYLLLCLFEGAGSFLAGLLGALLIASAAAVALWPLIRKGVSAVRAGAAVNRARRKEEKEKRAAIASAEKEQKAYRDMYERYLADGEKKPAAAEEEKEERPVLLRRAEAEGPMPSRVAETRSRVDNPAIPREDYSVRPKILSLSASELRESSISEAKISFRHRAAEGPAAPVSFPAGEPESLAGGKISRAPSAAPAPAVSVPAPASGEQAQEPKGRSAPAITAGDFLVENPQQDADAPLNEEDGKVSFRPFLGETAIREEPKPLSQEEPAPATPKAGEIIMPDYAAEEADTAEEPGTAATAIAPEPAPVSVPRENYPPYVAPSPELLKEYGPNLNAEKNEADANARMGVINQTFEDLNVPARVIGFTVGPSVTRYDVQTERDASVAGIGRYMQDVSIRLGGIPARFEQIVKGKPTSGLEIPNAVTAIVPFKEMFLSLPDNSDGRKNMYIPFGKSITGECMSSDLSDFPHMLVAGTTGSGKSIFLHGMIMSLIMRNTPDDLKLLLIDPKRVEMGKYKDLPHLLCPVVKEPSQAKIALQKLTEEMDKRYDSFEEACVSNIRQYNEDYVPDHPGAKKMPFIVVVVEEFADLKMTCKDIDDVVIRLTGKARAAGIHLIIATQRPSVDIVTGPVKANLGVKVALAVSSAINSRVILDEDGAETLLGHGDMLVDCPMMVRSSLVRLQGCMVDNKEINAVCNFIRSERPADYDPNFLDLADHEAEAKAQEEQAKLDRKDVKAMSDEEQYEQIKANIMCRDYASVSYIQRTFAIGFPKAGRIFNRLQAEGIVASEGASPTNNKGCRVLVHPEGSGTA